MYLVGVAFWIAAVVVSLLSSLAVAFTVALPALVVGVIEVSLALHVVDAVDADHGSAISRVLSNER
jgi:hypothetical protein